VDEQEQDQTTGRDTGAGELMTDEEFAEFHNLMADEDETKGAEKCV